MKNVCCATCGFLSLKSKLDGSVGTTSVETEFRESGHTDNNLFQQEAYCLKDAHRIDNECRREISKANQIRNKRGDRPECIAQVVKRQRDCDLWVEWHAGRSAKEHDEMKILQEVERVNREFQEKTTRSTEDYRKKVLAMSGLAIVVSVVSLIVSIWRWAVTAG